MIRVYQPSAKAAPKHVALFPPLFFSFTFFSFTAGHAMPTDVRSCVGRKQFWFRIHRSRQNWTAAGRPAAANASPPNSEHSSISKRVQFDVVLRREQVKGSRMRSSLPANG